MSQEDGLIITQTNTSFLQDDLEPNENIISFKKVFSSNVFIPMENELTPRSFNYLVGFIRLVETFKERTGWVNYNPEKPKEFRDNWGLYVYYDASLDEEIEESTYRPIFGNNNQNKIIKRNYNKNKDILKKLYQLYRDYLNIIKENSGKYDFIKIFSFKDTRINKKNKGYAGHPMTYGSMMRFLPLYDLEYQIIDKFSKKKITVYEKNIERVMVINISHAITPKMMELVNKWTGKKNPLLCIDYNIYDFSRFILIKNKFIDIFRRQTKLKRDSHGKNDKRIAAGIFGYLKSSRQTSPSNIFTHILPKLVSQYNQDIKKKKK